MEGVNKKVKTVCRLSFTCTITSGYGMAAELHCASYGVST